ncbi:MAG: hypothetical protein PVJ41_11980, partial [Desulfobacterales bacterium]
PVFFLKFRLLIATKTQSHQDIDNFSFFVLGVFVPSWPVSLFSLLKRETQKSDFVTLWQFSQ